MITALLQKIGLWILTKLAEWGWGKVSRSQERRSSTKEQEKKDQANKPSYDQVVQTGDEHAIEDATEDYLNGR